MTMLMRLARYAGIHIEKANTEKEKLAEGHVLIGFAREEEMVYNFEIEGEHEYFSNGVLSHNCDSLRYALEPVMRARSVSLVQ